MYNRQYVTASVNKCCSFSVTRQALTVFFFNRLKSKRLSPKAKMFFHSKGKANISSVLCNYGLGTVKALASVQKPIHLILQGR